MTATRDLYLGALPSMLLLRSSGFELLVYAKSGHIRTLQHFVFLQFASALNPYPQRDTKDRSWTPTVKMCEFVRCIVCVPLFSAFIDPLLRAEWRRHSSYVFALLGIEASLPLNK